MAPEHIGPESLENIGMAKPMRPEGVEISSRNERHCMWERLLRKY